MKNRMNRNDKDPRGSRILPIAPLFVATILVSCVNQNAIMAAGDANPTATPSSIVSEKAQQEKIMNEVTRPNDVREFLVNILKAFDSDIFLKEETYQENMLTRIFGGDQIRWRMHTKDKQWTWVSSFGDLFKKAKINQSEVEGITVSCDRTVKNTKAYAEVDISITVDSGPKFESIQDIFGNNWNEYISPIIPPHPLPYFPPTHPMGNKTISYTRKGEASRASMIVKFNPNGSLRELNISAEEK